MEKRLTREEKLNILKSITLEQFDIHSMVKLPNNWAQMNVKEKNQFAINNLEKIEKEYSQIFSGKSYLQYIYGKNYYQKAYDTLNKVCAQCQKTDKENLHEWFELWVSLFEKETTVKGLIWQYNFERQYSLFLDHQVPDILWDYYKRHPEHDFVAQENRIFEREQAEKKARQEALFAEIDAKNNKHKTNNVKNAGSGMELFASGRYITPQEHEIRYDKDGNKHYQQRPVKYDSFDELWFIIPVLLFLCLTGWGGVVFSIIVLIVYFRYVEVRTQRKWENECDFVELYSGKKKIK